MGNRLMIAAAALSLTFATTAYGQEQLTVNTYTGSWATNMKKCIFDPFQKAMNVTLQLDSKLSAVTYTSLRQQKGSPEVDVAWMDGGDSERAWTDGLTDEIDPSKMPNIAGISERALYKKDGKIYAAGTGFYATTVFQNTKETKGELTSWWDLWKPEYANRVALPGPELANFAPIFLFLNKQLGGDSKNLEPAIAKFSQLKAYSYYTSTGVIAGPIQTGEVIAGVHYAGSVWGIKDQGLPLAVVTPKEGVVAGDMRIHLVKGTKRKALAEKLVNFTLSADVLNCLADTLYVGPPLKSPKVSDTAKERMPWGATGSIDNLAIPDYYEVLEMRPVINDLWNRRVVQK